MGGQHVSLPRLLDGVLQVRGYPLEMVLAEKLATAIARGTANTRCHLQGSLDRVAQYRKVTITPLASVLVGYSEIGQARWVAWLRKQRLETMIPTEFSVVLDYIVSFADPITRSQESDRGIWDPGLRRWQA